MDNIYDRIKIEENMESENIFSVRRNNYDEIDYKSPNKIIQKHDINSEISEVQKTNILNINHFLKEKDIYESKNVFSNEKDKPLSDIKEDSPSDKLYRKNSAYNKSKGALNINKLKNDLITNLQNVQPPTKNQKNQKNSKKGTNKYKEGKYEKITLLYKPHIDFIKKKTIFLILFAIGIIFAMMNLFLSIALTLYGNIEILAIFIIINLFLIFFYAIGIYFFEKNQMYTQKIITNIQSPDKIEHSYYKNNIYLLIYFLLFAFNYYLVTMVGLSSYKNNIKLDIKSRAYDKNKWRFYFQNKSFEKVLSVYEKINIAVMIFGWSSIIILIIIFILFIHYFGSYRFWKRIIQAFCFLFGQISFLLLNISAYCFQFRNITLLDEFKLKWVIIGLIMSSLLGVILSIVYFYMFYTDNIKLMEIFNYLGILLIISFIVFSAGAKAFGLKFQDYKTANCNNLFKFISEDYLVKNKDCSRKYLFSQDSLKDMECPKERIIINWEETEKRIKEGRDDEDYPVFGCINQYCCLKIYGKLKNGFNVQEILAFNQLFLYIILFFSNKYIKNRIKKFLEEEVIEKFNLLTVIFFTLVIYIICFIIIVSRPPTSSQNVLNDIQLEPKTTENSVVNKNLVSLSEENLLIEETNNLWNELINNYFLEYNFDIIHNHDNDFNFEFFEYNISSYNVYIQKINNKDNLSDVLLEYKIFNDVNNVYIINFKAKKFVINSLNKYFKFSPKFLFQLENTILISCNIIYSSEKEEEYFLNQISNIQSSTSNTNSNSFFKKNITITNELILQNYDTNSKKSIINLFSNESLSLLNNEYIINNKSDTISFFNIKGNIYNDTGFSLINIYHKINNTKNLIFSGKTNIKGEFSIGPFYLYTNTSLIFQFDIEINKVNSSDILLYDNNYNNYTLTIKIGGYDFNKEFPPILNNITLIPKLKGDYKISGLVYKFTDDKELESVTVKLYKGYKNIGQNDDEIDDINLLKKVVTNQNGLYNLNINQNGQYTLIFMKDDYFIEKYEFIIDTSDIIIKNMGMIQLFNSGKMVVKMDWENNPPDLDLICRFEPKEKNFCYTFFGNNKCVDTNYPIDNRKGGFNGEEIIEVEVLGEYNYFFYIRKYFDISNNKAKDEKKLNDFENENNNISLYYKQNDELIQKSKVKLSIYANGIKIPAFVLNIPNEQNFNEKYNYWGGFCFDGKKGLNGINIINKFFEMEPPRNICSG